MELAIEFQSSACVYGVQFNDQRMTGYGFDIQISMNSRERLMDQDLMVGSYADALAAAAVIDGLDPNEVLGLFLDSRKSWIEQKMNGEVNGVDCGSILCNVVNIVKTTLGQGYLIDRKFEKVVAAESFYREKVRIPQGKGYLMLEGDGTNMTVISWSDHDANVSQYNHHTNRYKGTVNRYSKRYNPTIDNDSATLAVWAENVVLKNLAIKNNYGRGNFQGKAVAATLAADKIAVYGCKFIGIQDMLCDLYDRHYFKDCNIEGVVDFIWGFGQSLYEQQKQKSQKPLLFITKAMAISNMFKKL